jgi:hypothetical protein
MEDRWSLIVTRFIKRQIKIFNLFRKKILLMKKVENSSKIPRRNLIIKKLVQNTPKNQK